MKHDEVSHWIRQADYALRKHLDREFPDELPSEPAAAAARFNQLLEFLESLGDLNQKFGMSPSKADFHNMVSEAWLTSSGRELTAGELRALISSILYREKFRLQSAGPKDGDMKAAKDASEIFRRAISQIGEEATDDEFIEAYAQELSEKSLLDRDDYETVHKSIARYKAKLEGKHLYWLNPETFRLEVRTESALSYGHTVKRGRPKFKG